jgi:hypothetical protein
MWSVLEHRVTQQGSAGDPAITSDIETAAFFNLLQCLPPHLLLTNCPGQSTVLGLDELRCAVIDKGRNHVVRGIALPVGVVSHVLLMLASVQEGHCGDAVSSFLRDCPLVLTSILVHWAAVGRIVLTSFRCLNALQVFVRQPIIARCTYILAQLKRQLAERIE